ASQRPAARTPSVPGADANCARRETSSGLTSPRRNRSMAGKSWALRQQEARKRSREAFQGRGDLQEGFHPALGKRLPKQDAPPAVGPILRQFRGGCKCLRRVGVLQLQAEVASQ